MWRELAGGYVGGATQDRVIWRWCAAGPVTGALAY